MIEYKPIKYGLCLNDINFVDHKLNKQKDFLKNFVLDLGGKELNMLDSSMGANINPKKYFSEVNNRVNALFEYSKSLNLFPVFLTITCPSNYHPTSKDYDPNLSVKDSTRYLSNSWARFNRLKIFTRMKKAINHNMIYVRVLEPHKSGVPHSHVLLFVPKNYVHDLRKIYKRHFSKSEFSNVRANDFRYTLHNQSGGALGYLMKYINKTFKNALEDRMTLEAYYFAFHSIRRFTSSQTLIPVSIHRKIKWHVDFQDFLICTYHYKSGALYSQFNKRFVLYDNGDPDDPNEKVIYAKNLMIEGNFKKAPTRVPVKITHFEEEKPPIPVLIDGVKYVLRNKDLIKVSRSVLSYSNNELLTVYRECDVDKVNIDFFINIRNELVKRNLLTNFGYLPDQIYGFVFNHLKLPAKVF